MLGVFNWFCNFEYSPFIAHNFNSDYIGDICFEALTDSYFIYHWPLYSSLYIRTDKFNIIWATTNKVACSKSQTKRVCTQEIIKRYNSLLTFTSPHILNFEHGAHYYTFYLINHRLAIINKDLVTTMLNENCHECLVRSSYIIIRFSEQFIKDRGTISLTNIR